ncbi:hypothetical protein NEISICOT_00950 [Neisseria sicca ATCC 29256]|uniref:Uncharacterized protein n=1 Tax=Neisseria sicca ATCC 29256 TaxID=547045 RepID=C6M360_NEISI|nr:hypothetical protein NEISICOT_00950 [Neisseria sicca ATCC 29256]
MQVDGGGLHFVLQGAGQFVGFAVEEGGGLAHAVAVVFFADVSDAGRGAAFDLIQQARAVAVFEHAVFAGAQHEDFLQDLNAVAHGVAVGIGAEVLVRLFQRAAVIRHLRILMPAEHEVGIAFVIAEEDIVFGRQGFDEVVFENQGFGFGAGDGGFNVMNLFHHQCDARGMVVFLEIAGHAPLEVDRFADV